jgi:hypothetical protein
VERAGRGRGLEQRRWLRGGGEEDGGLGGHGGRLVGGEEELLGASGLVVVTGDKVGSGRAALLYYPAGGPWPLRPTQATCGSSSLTHATPHLQKPLCLCFALHLFVSFWMVPSQGLHIVAVRKIKRLCHCHCHCHCCYDHKLVAQVSCSRTVEKESLVF